MEEKDCTESFNSASGTQDLTFSAVLDLKLVF